MAEENKVSAKVEPVKEEAAATAAVPAPKVAAAAFKIVTATQRVRYMNGMFYGDYGTGKSTLLATAAEVDSFKDVLFINAEAGDASVEHFDLDLVDVTNYGQFARVHEFLRLHCKLRDATKEGDAEARTKLIKLEAMFRGVEPKDIEEPKMYHTVCIDTLTEVQKYCMYQLLGIKIGDFALDLEPETPQFAEWGKSAEMIRLLVRSFRDLPMHALFACARGEDQDQTKRFHYRPLLPGKLSNEVQGFFDIVGYLTASPTEGGEIHRRLYLEPGQTYSAKNRFVNFEGRYIDEPSMSKLAEFRLPIKK